MLHFMLPSNISIVETDIIFCGKVHVVYFTRFRRSCACKLWLVEFYQFALLLLQESLFAIVIMIDSNVKGNPINVASDYHQLLLKALNDCPIQ